MAYIYSFMKFKHFTILFAASAFFFASCSKNNSGNQAPTKTTSGDTTATTVPTNTPYSLTETFEAGKKTAYADSTIQLSTGMWDFNLALIGNLAGDVKDGSWAVRIETTGSLAMKFDIKGVTQISVKHARYGSDPVSSWQMMESTDGGVTYTQIGSTITETTATTFTTDSFKVNVAANVRFKIQKASSTGTNRIDIDDITFKGTGDPGITLTDPGSGDDGSGTTTGTATAPHGVTVGTDAPPETGDNSNLLMGNPTSATSDLVMMDNYLIDQGYYVESYNSTKGEPNWVSWHLDATNITGVTGRTDDFAGFSGLPAAWYQVESNSYSGSGFDRGHNCPSADRTSSVDANDATFLMTNMIPQAPQNNQQTWANLENYIRDQVVAGYEAYIIMGSYGSGGTGSINTATTVNNGHVNVPSNVWKVAIIIPAGNGDISRITANTRIIAVNTPNINTINSDWTQYITTVKAIETANGNNLDLLSALPASIKAALEVKVDSGN